MKFWENPVIAEISFVDTAEGSDTVTVPDKEFTDANGEKYWGFRS